jgi:hypothetical protein
MFKALPWPENKIMLMKLFKKLVDIKAMVLLVSKDIKLLLLIVRVLLKLLLMANLFQS